MPLLTLLVALTLFPLSVSPDGRCLVDAGGKPFLIHGDTPWSLTHNLTFEESVRYMEDRRARGFNTLMVSVPDAYDAEGEATYPPDRYGNHPFRNDDITQPVEPYWSNVDRVFSKAEELGILLLVTPAYLGCCKDGYEQLLVKNGASRSLAYGRWLGRRYAARKNVIWVHGGDRNPFAAEQEVRVVARGIRETAPAHLHTAHWANGTSAFDHVDDTGPLEINSSYTYGPVAWRIMYDRLVQPSKPTFLIETHYENDFGKRTAEDVRRYPYRAILAGAAGHLFGNRPLWFCGKGWEKSLDSPGSRYMAHVRALFEPRPWHQLVPDMTHQAVVEGADESGSDEGVQVALTRSGTNLMALVPANRMIRVNLARLSGPNLRASWFDTRTGQWKEIGSVGTSGFREFRSPMEGDHVLVIEPAK